MTFSNGRILAVGIGQEYPTVILGRVAQRVAVPGEASQGYDPGPPHVTAQVQDGKSWNLHMGLTALRSVGSTESRWCHLPHRAQAPDIPYHKSQIQVTSVIDLTERNRAKEELRESEGRYRRWSSKPPRASCYST